MKYGRGALLALAITCVLVGTPLAAEAKPEVYRIGGSQMLVLQKQGKVLHATWMSKFRIDSGAGLVRGRHIFLSASSKATGDPSVLSCTVRGRRLRCQLASTAAKKSFATFQGRQVSHYPDLEYRGTLRGFGKNIGAVMTFTKSGEIDKDSVAYDVSLKLGKIMLTGQTVWLGDTIGGGLTRFNMIASSYHYTRKGRTLHGGYIPSNEDFQMGEFEATTKARRVRMKPTELHSAVAKLACRCTDGHCAVLSARAFYRFGGSLGRTKPQIAKCLAKFGVEKLHLTKGVNKSDAKRIGAWKPKPPKTISPDTKPAASSPVAIGKPFALPELTSKIHLGMTRQALAKVLPKNATAEMAVKKAFGKKPPAGTTMRDTHTGITVFLFKGYVAGVQFACGEDDHSGTCKPYNKKKGPLGAFVKGVLASMGAKKSYNLGSDATFKAGDVVFEIGIDRHSSPAMGPMHITVAALRSTKVFK